MTRRVLWMTILLNLSGDVHADVYVRWNGDRVILGSNPAVATLFRELWKFRLGPTPALPVSFGGDTT